MIEICYFYSIRLNYDGIKIKEQVSCEATKSTVLNHGVNINLFLDHEVSDLPLSVIFIVLKSSVSKTIDSIR